MNNTINASQIPRPIIEHRSDERTIKATANSISSPSMIPIEIHHDQRTVMSATTMAPPLPSSPSSIENRFDERVTTAAVTNISPTRIQPLETHIEQSIVMPTTISNSLPPRLPPPPPPPPSISNEVIYTEVIKSHERPLSLHHIDLVKAPISPSRSFIIPKKITKYLIKKFII